MIDLGIVKPGSTIRIPFPTFTSDDPQASATVTAFVAADIEIYKDGSTTQRASDAGYTVTVDFDTTTGVQLVAVDLADNTIAGFYASGSEYFIIAGPFTLDAATINAPIARFIIGMPHADLNTTIATLASQLSFTLTKGPEDDDALNGCVMYAHDVASEVRGGYAVVSDYTGLTKTVTLTAGPTFTMVATDNVHFYPPTNVNYVSSTAQTANDNGADINAIKVVTDAQAATGTGLSAIPWNASWDAEVQSEVNDALVALGLDHLVAASVTGADVTDNSIIAYLVSKEATADWDDYDNIVDSLPALETHINNIASTGAAFHVAAESYTLTTGTQSANLYTDTETRNETSHEHTDTAGTTDLYYQFDVGTYGQAVEVEYTALINGANDSITVSVYDWVGAGWQTIDTIPGTNSNTYTTDIEALYAKNTGTGGNLGKVRIRFNATGLTTSTLKVDQVFIAYAQNIQVILGTPTDTDISTDITNVQTEVDKIDELTTQGDTNETKLDTIDTVVDAVLALLDDARAEPGQGAPPVNADLATKIDYLYKNWRNKKEETATTFSLYNDAGTTVDQKATVADDNTTASKTEIASGP